MGWIVGTAGHIDHGKTSLVKALTGQDTDRLKEEKARGISIDLGFASMQLPGGERVGVVDVPGHERFIRNMLAGAHGIDLALFTVAADDGVMPQTEEHLDIVHLLGVRRGIFVITKKDLASADRLEEVADGIRVLAHGTAFEVAPILSCSVVTGDGLEAVRAEIASMLAALSALDRPRSSGLFRLPIDRAFYVQGHGLVVTGTAIAGQIETGARVRCLPAGDMLRVRSIQVHDRSVDRAVAGQRVALNLGGLERDTLVRGEVIADERLTRATSRFDARLERRVTLGVRGKELFKPHQRVRVHLGTAERVGRIVRVDARAEAGQGAIYGQIVVNEPLLALRGDRFIVRDETAQRTLGGGTVIDPWPAPLRRRDLARSARLTALEGTSTAEVTRAYLEGTPDLVVPWSSLRQFLDDERAEPPDLPGVRTFRSDSEPSCAAVSRVGAVERAVITTLMAFHAAHPLALGMDIEEARATMPERMSPRVFRELVESLETAGRIVREGNVLRAGEHRTRLTAGDQACLKAIEDALSAQPLTPPELPELQTRLGVERQRLAELLKLLEQDGRITKVTPVMYFLRAALDRVRAMLVERLTGGATITAAALRDELKISRKFAIPLLEYFDKTGLTVRVGDARKLRQPLPRSSP